MDIEFIFIDIKRIFMDSLDIYGYGRIFMYNKRIF